MKIHIGEKYMFILDNKGRDIAHFEHFEVKNVKNPVIDFTIEDTRGGNFVRKNCYKIKHYDVYWFSKKKLTYRVMFVKGCKNSAFSYMVLIKPQSLKVATQRQEIIHYKR